MARKSSRSVWSPIIRTHFEAKKEPRDNSRSLPAHSALELKETAFKLNKLVHELKSSALKLNVPVLKLKETAPELKIDPLKPA